MTLPLPSVLIPTPIGAVFAFFTGLSSLCVFSVWHRVKGFHKMALDHQTVAMVVIGDVGCSPRMQNHALMALNWMIKHEESHKRNQDADKENRNLTRLGSHADFPFSQIRLVGYCDSKCRPELLGDDRFQVIELKRVLTNPKVRECMLSNLGTLGFLIFAFLRIIDVTLALFVALTSIHGLTHVILQNPPSFPAILVIKFIAALTGSSLTLDWHNYGFTLLSTTTPAVDNRQDVQEKLSRSFSVYQEDLLDDIAKRSVNTRSNFQKLVELVAEKIEIESCRRLGDNHLCVSKALMNDLFTKGVRNVLTLYDRPPCHFKPLSMLQIHITLSKYFNLDQSPQRLKRSESSNLGMRCSSNESNCFSNGSYSDLPAQKTKRQDPIVVEARIPSSSSSETLKQIDSILLKPDCTTCLVNLPYSENRVFKVTLPLEDDVKGLFGALIGDCQTNWKSDVSQWPNTSCTALTEASFSIEQNSANVGTFTYKYRSDRPAMLVTSTSWTPDEDLLLLLDALEVYDEVWRRQRSSSTVGGELSSIPEVEEHELLPRLIVLVTGKGPMKEQWIRTASGKDFAAIKIITVFCPSEDYPLLLGCADLGICLHYSSSGLDLPMKMVDMQGVSLPCLAFGYEALHEMLDDNGSVILYSNAQELSDRLVDVLMGFKSNAPDTDICKLQKMKYGAIVAQSKRRTLEQEWMSVVSPILQSDCHRISEM